MRDLLLAMKADEAAALASRVTDERLSLLIRLSREALAGPLGSIERAEAHTVLAAYEAERDKRAGGGA